MAKLTDNIKNDVKQLYLEDKTIQEIMEELKISKASVYRLIKEIKNENDKN